MSTCTTAEPGRRRPYDKDLRWTTMSLTFNKIASNLNISIATAQRVYTKFEQTGNVDSKSADRTATRCYDDYQELLIIGMFMQELSLYLGELCQQINGLEMSPATVCRLLKRYGMTRKKIRQVAKQRCHSLRGAFMAHCLLFRRDMFVWVDETGTNNRDHIRSTVRGMTPTCTRHLVRGKRTNAIVGLTSGGVIASEIITTTVN